MKHPPTPAKASPDRAIVDTLATEAFPQYTLDLEPLYNWQTETGATSPAALESAACRVIGEYPAGALFFDRPRRNALETCLRQSAALPDGVYAGFKLAVHSLVLHAVTPLHTAKLQLHQLGFTAFLVDDFLSWLEAAQGEPARPPGAGDALAEAKTALLVEFLDLGCSARLLRRLLLPLFAKSTRVRYGMKRRLFELLATCVRRYPSQFDVLNFHSFASKPVCVPFASEPGPLRCFTVSMWFKINELCIPDPNASLSLLTLSSNTPESSALEVQVVNSKFVVTATGTADTRLTFNHSIQPKPQNQYYSHLILSYDEHQNMNLFVDGEYSESIPCGALSKTENRWSRAQIGARRGASRGQNELLLKDLAVLNSAYSLEWVNLAYHLGVGHNWAQKDFSDNHILGLVDQLSPASLKSLCSRLTEIAEMKVSREAQPTSSVYTSSRARRSHRNDRDLVFESLRSSTIKPENILFDSTDPDFLAAIAHGNNADVSLHQPSSIYDSVFCWGGSGLLLSLIEAVMKDQYAHEEERDFFFLQAVSLLLLCLRNDRRLQLEFETVDGFWILNMLASYYKDTYNPTLSFDEEDPGEDTDCFGGFGNSLLARFLNYSCRRRPNSLDNIIADPQAFKFLVLNFGLFGGTCEMKVLLTALERLVATDKGRAENGAELSKMKLTKRALQHVKVRLLNDEINAEHAEALANFLKLVVQIDGSADSVKGLSQFIVFALYHDPKDAVSAELAFHALQALTDKLCGPSSSLKVLKRFSRSITIHWILLLLDFKGPDKVLSAKVVCCAIALLAKFLRVLGPHIIKRFFYNSKGLDVLVYFLRGWWNNDSVMSFLFWGSFAIDRTSTDILAATIPQLAKDKSITQAVSALAIPDFIVLINTLALTGITRLRQETGNVLSSPSSPIRNSTHHESKEIQILDLSFDVIHLLNQLSDIIEIGLAESPALQAVFVSKEWLEVIFEVLTHLNFIAVDKKTDPQLKRNFCKCYQRLRSVLSSIFVDKILNVKQIFSILKGLNDITTKIILHSIFPQIFIHINEFVGDSNFIFKETEFARGAVELLTLYHHEFILQNYYVSLEDFDTFMNCTVSIIEINGSSSNHLGPVLGKSLILKMSNLVGLENESEDAFASRLDDNVKFLLYKIALILQPDVLSEEMLAQMIDLIMGSFLKLSQEGQFKLAEHVLNFVRTAAMIRKDHFSQVLNKVSALSDYRNSSAILTEFFEYLATRNDEDTVKHIQRYPTIKHIFHKNFQFQISKSKEIGTINVLDMVQIVLHNGGTLAHMNSAQFERFDRDCQSLRNLSVNGELVKYNRELQDRKENLAFFSATYNSIKAEISRLLEDSTISQNDYMLDYIEGADRARRLLVVEDHLPESERLTYNIEIPIKQVPLSSEVDGFEFISHSFGNLAIAEDSGEHEDEAAETSKKGYEDRNRKVLHSLYQGDQIQALFNISKINGLDAIGSLMVLGSSHLYVIENYFCTDGNVVDIDEAPRELRDNYLQFIKPQGATKSHSTRSWNLDRFSCISRRKFLLRNTALELFFADGASLLVTCLTTAERDSIYNKLQPLASGAGLDKDLATTLEMSSFTSSMKQNPGGFRSKLASAFSSFAPSFSEITRKWRCGKMSNFYYLMAVNTMAGRTCNDLTQYPVFPWVIADYDSETLDLCDPRTFRDLSKPMGAQSPKRAAQFQERYSALESMADANSPPFHYGVHYSSAMIVASFLIRLKPYVQSYLLLQGGKFDHADRLFNSVQKAWLSASQDNTSDVRELTPEFFYLPEFLRNSNNFELGKLQSGEHPNDVELPRWAHGDPKMFIAKNREALESPYVSANLHKWIDLVFGCKQTGADAVAALNVFHHSSYDGAIDVDNIENDVEKRAVIGMINNFGQTPLKVFSKPHPARDILNLPNLYMSKAFRAPVCTFESRLHLAIGKLEISAKTGKWIGRPACTSSEDRLVVMQATSHKNRAGSGSLLINNVLFANLQPTRVTFLLQLANGYFVTGSENGVIYVWRCPLKPLKVSCHHVLRGHSSEVRHLAHSKTFNVCLSVDARGGIILWDMTRFKFVRRICNPGPNVLVAVSNDTGNFCTVCSTKYSNVLTMYTLNGEEITQLQLAPGPVSAVAIACVNDSLVDSVVSEFRHAYWSTELVAVAYSSPNSVHIYELQAGPAGWEMPLWHTLALQGGFVTTMCVFKATETDPEEKLNRGSLRLVYGDSLGKVHTIN